MERFVKRYGDRIVGSIAGFDRILFKGNLSSICHVEGMERFLSSQHVLQKDFSEFVQRISQRVKEHAAQLAARQRAPADSSELAERIEGRLRAPTHRARADY